MAKRLRDTIAPRRRPRLLLDPRDGDVETDASSTESRSLLALAGNLLAEVSLPKMAAAIVLLIVLPAVLLGAAPLAVTIWLDTVAATPRASAVGAAIVLFALLVLAWFGGRKLLRLVERSFWALNAMAIQPVYAACREGMLHLAGRVMGASASEARLARVRALVSAIAGLLICGLAVWALVRLWPSARWSGNLGGLRAPHLLAMAALVNATVLSLAYLAVAALVWGLADATMPQPRTLERYSARRDLVRTWRVAHVSDIHVVGERFGFRLGSGRAGPRGNSAFREVLRLLEELHRREPLDAILITGDLTDAGTSAEWAELLDALELFPELAELIVALPGNHDVNVVDRANPARFDLPTSPKKHLRQMRTLSALAAMQGTRARVVDARTGRVGDTVDAMLAPHAEQIRTFADRGSWRLGGATEGAWLTSFPMVVPPADEDGLGIVALDSNADTHFSFTNALGLVSAEQTHALEEAMRAFPRASWIVALHHHVVEHPALGHALAERIGTTLVNGNWFTRRLLGVADRVVVMHGHRHIDWIGSCGGLLIVSAPSAVIPAKGRDDVYFHVHTIGVDAAGRVALAEPEQVVVEHRERSE